MADSKKQKRTCVNGHTFYKSSDCPVCPICEGKRKPADGFPSLLSAPARRAMENAQIDSLEKLSTYTEKEILSLHGLGKSSLPVLNALLAKEKLSFKK